MSALPKEALRRGWCPSTLRPMETGDGWLVRLHPPGAQLTPPQLRRIAALAAEHGNGLVEISARANLQIRGVTPASHPMLVERLLAERLVDEHEGDGPQRLTLVSPLAGPCRHSGASRSEEPGIHEHSRGRRSADDSSAPTIGDEVQGLQALGVTAPRNDGQGLINAAALSAAIEKRARSIAGLPAKLCVIVDDGGPQVLNGFACDIRLVAVASGRMVVGLADTIWRGPVSELDAPAIVETVLRGFARARSAAPERIRRLRDLSAAALSGLGGLAETAAPAPRAAPRRAGLFALAGDRFAALVNLPFGRCDAATLDKLGAGVGTQQADIRFSPWRGLAFRNLSHVDAEAMLALANDLGLITRDDDPRLSVQACAGSLACSRAEAPAMADAAKLAEAASDLLAQGATLHVSGCIKSCAHPAAADLTLVGRDGRYDVVLGGTARDKPLATLDLSTLMARLQPGEEIHARLTNAARITGPRG